MGWFSGGDDDAEAFDAMVEKYGEPVRAVNSARARAKALANPTRYWGRVIESYVEDMNPDICDGCKDHFAEGSEMVDTECGQHLCPGCWNWHWREECRQCLRTMDADSDSRLRKLGGYEDEDVFLKGGGLETETEINYYDYDDPYR